MNKNRILGLHGRKGNDDQPEYSTKAIENALAHGGIFLWIFYNYAHRLLVGKPVWEGANKKYRSLQLIEELSKDCIRPFVAVYPFVDPCFEDGQNRFLELAMDAVSQMRGGNFDFGIFSPDEKFLKAYSPENAGSIFEKARAEPGYLPDNAEQNIRNHLSADKGLLAGGLKAAKRDPVEAARNVGAKFVAVYGKEYSNEEIRQMSEAANSLGITVIANVQADFSRARNLIKWAWIIANDPEAAYECAFPDAES